MRRPRDGHAGVEPARRLTARGAAAAMTTRPTPTAPTRRSDTAAATDRHRGDRRPADTDAPAATTTDDAATQPAGGMPTELGEGEGEVNLIAWAGYVEDGSTDPAVDWVTAVRGADRLHASTSSSATRATRWCS